MLCHIDNTGMKLELPKQDLMRDVELVELGPRRGSLRSWITLIFFGCVAPLFYPLHSKFLIQIIVFCNSALSERERILQLVTSCTNPQWDLPFPVSLATSTALTTLPFSALM